MTNNEIQSFRTTCKFSKGNFDAADRNKSFAPCVVKIAYDGRNNNRTDISKEVFETAISTIYNVPIVAHVIKDDNGYVVDFGGHDTEYRDDGTEVNLTEPIGVIPESANHWWETETDPTGEHDYLCVDGLLWKRQAAYEFLEAEGETAQSMEIDILYSHKEGGAVKCDAIEFQALCALGNRYTPCFESASVSTYCYNDEHFIEVMKEFKAEFSLAKNKNNNTTEKGAERVADFQLNGMELANALGEALRARETINCDWGEYPRYSLVDYNFETSEVYAWDNTGDNLVGFNYTVSGDTVNVDFETGKKKKYAIVDFEEGDTATNIYNLVKIGTDRAKAEGEYNLAQAKADYDAQLASKDETIGELNTKVSALESFKLDTENNNFVQSINEVFSGFEELSAIEAYQALKAEFDEKQGAFEYDKDNLTEKLYAIKGRNIDAVRKYTKTPDKSKGTPKIPSGQAQEPDPEPYGGVFAKY